MRFILLRLLTVLAMAGSLLPLVAGTSYALEIPETQFAKLTLVRPGEELSSLAMTASTRFREMPFRTTHLGIHWSGEGEIEIRTSLDRDSWTSWELVAESHDMSDDEAGTYAALVSGLSARYVEVRVGEGVDPLSVELAAINTQDGPRRRVMVERSASGATPQPHVISRAEWGADESFRKGSPGFSKVRKLFVHHTVTRNDDPDPAATVRAIYAMHTRSNGWNDIGYNFLIDAQGRIYEGRYSRPYAAGEVPTGETENGLGVIGAHVGGYNTGSVGVAMLGTFTSVLPSDSARNALVEMLAWKADRHGITPHGSDLYVNSSSGVSESFPNIAGHRDVGSTACPGSVLYDHLPSIRDRVEHRIAALTGLSAPGMPTGTTLMPSGASRDLTPNATGSVSRTTTRVEITFDGKAPLSDRTISVPAGSGGFSLVDAHYNGVPLQEDEYRVTAKAYDSSGRESPPAPVADSYYVTKGELPADGYWVLGSDGGIFTYGSAAFYGSTGGMRLNAPVVGMAATPSGKGYWLVATDGGIFTFGDARFYGSTGGMRLDKPVVGMAPTKSGNGYWLVASDGGIFSFGDAAFYGSMGGRPINKPVVGMARTQGGNGYWMVASDGGIFTFGDGGFYGSTGAMRLDRPVVGMAPTKSGNGYWMVASDGGIFSFGDAAFYGSGPGRGIKTGIVSMAVTFTGRGYYLVGDQGSMFRFGDAPAYSSPPEQGYSITARGAALAPASQ